MIFTAVFITVVLISRYLCKFSEPADPERSGYIFIGWYTQAEITESTEQYDFVLPDAMVTNFHMPFSTMLMLVCSYGGYELVMDAYDVALKENYRFGTYGDAMLILNK